MKPEKLDELLTLLYQQQEASESFESGWRAAIRREERLMMDEKKLNKKWNWRTVWKAAVPAFCALLLIIGSLSVADFAKNNRSVSNSVELNDSAYSNPSDYSNSKGTAALGSPEVKMASKSRSTEFEAAEIMADSMDYGNGIAGASSNEESSGAFYDSTLERKLIRTVSLTIRTVNYDEDYAAIQTLLKETGGYVEYSSRSGDGKNGNARRTYLTLRVPSARLDEFLNGTEGIGRVTEITESTVDQTTAYYDNETRLNTLRDKLNRLNELMKEAGDLSDLIELEGAVSDTQYQIDSYETAQRMIQNRVDMSEVSLELREETVREQTQVKEYSLGERIAAAFESGWKAFLTFFGNLLVFLTMALPVIAAVGVVIAVIVIIRRKKTVAKEKQNQREE